MKDYIIRATDFVADYDPSDKGGNFEGECTDRFVGGLNSMVFKFLDDSLKSHDLRDIRVTVSHINREKYNYNEEGEAEYRNHTCPY